MAKTSLERRQSIVQRVTTRGHVAVRELAEGMGVSEATVRRDLRLLAEQNELELVYGGATALRAPDHSIESRSQINVEAKQAIGHAAAALVRDGDTVFVDAGTTCFEMRHGLRRRSGLTVILNSTRLAAELGINRDLNVLMLGGQYRPDTMDTIGPMTDSAIEQLRGYTAFIGADGLSSEFGIAAADIQTAYLYKHLLRNARETVLLVDHEKFGSPSLYQIAGWDAVHRVVTDRRPPAEWLRFLQDRGIDLVLADPLPTH